MALSKFTLTNGFWRKISAAGEDGTAWIKRHDGRRSVILIAHTAVIQTPDTDNITYANGLLKDLDIDIAYELPIDNERISVELNADSGSDIYYATIRDADETCEIIVDFG